jgi:hypothetical protein
MTVSERECESDGTVRGDVDRGRAVEAAVLRCLCAGRGVIAGVVGWDGWGRFRLLALQWPSTWASYSSSSNLLGPAAANVRGMGKCRPGISGRERGRGVRGGERSGTLGNGRGLVVAAVCVRAHRPCIAVAGERVGGAGPRSAVRGRLASRVVIEIELNLKHLGPNFHISSTGYNCVMCRNCADLSQTSRAKFPYRLHRI